MVKMINIYQDKQTKKWFFRAYLGIDENGKKVQKTKRGFLTQREAKQAYDSYLLTHGMHQVVSSHASKLKTVNQMTFEEFYRIRFVNWYEKQVKSQTYENARFIFEKRMRYFYGFKVREITSQDIEDWLYELSKTATRNSRNRDKTVTLSKNYINRILGHLKIILKRAVKEGIIERNPVDSVSSLPKENTKINFWEIDEFQEVMDAIPSTSLENQHRKIVFETLFYTGVRIGELSALTWNDVDLNKKQITVEKTLIYKGKNDWYLSTPKTNTSYRTIGIGEKLSEKLTRWKDLQSRIGNFEFVFQLDGTFTPPYCFSVWLKDYAKKVNIPPIKIHGLRHSHVAMLIQKNIQPLVIKERLGHSNIQITLGTYGHLYAKSDEQVVSVLDELIS